MNEPNLNFDPPRWRSGEGVVLLRSRTRVGFPAAAAALLTEAKSKNASAFEISAQVKDPQVVKIKPAPSTTARLIAQL